ncbi:MAG: hypothetical protein ABIP85_21545, partial [Chthoniobacteraceae bacterium]
NSPATVPNPHAKRYFAKSNEEILFSCCKQDSHINDPKLSDRGGRRGTCVVGGKAAVEAGAVTHGAVRCSAWM